MSSHEPPHALAQAHLHTRPRTPLQLASRAYVTVAASYNPVKEIIKSLVCDCHEFGDQCNSLANIKIGFALICDSGEYFVSVCHPASSAMRAGGKQASGRA